MAYLIVINFRRIKISRELIFAGTNFREFLDFGYFTGTNFHVFLIKNDQNGIEFSKTNRLVMFANILNQKHINLAKNQDFWH